MPMSTDSDSTLPLTPEQQEALGAYLSLLALRADPEAALGAERLAELQEEADKARARAQAEPDVLLRMQYLHAAHMAERQAKGLVDDETFNRAEDVFIDTVPAATEALGVEPGYWRELGVSAPVLRRAGLVAKPGRPKGSKSMPAVPVVRRQHGKRSLIEDDTPTVRLSGSVTLEEREAIYANPAAQHIEQKQERTLLLFLEDERNDWRALRTGSNPMPIAQTKHRSTTITLAIPADLWESAQSAYAPRGKLTAGRAVRLFIAEYL